VPVIGHESCHLSMARFTKGASVKEEFRFFDEGFASVFEHMLANDSDKYKKTVLRIAAQQNQKDNVNFVKVQKWSEYFGNPNIAINGYAYPVGASFVYYLSDTYGMDFFLSFCKDIGDTYDLDQSCRNIFKQNRNTIEAGWKEYLRNVPLPGPPRIVKMFPENGATQVSLKTTEICVEFDVPMAKRIVVISNGNGVSYKNAYWKTERILAVKVGLMPSHVYQISLGSSSGNRLLSEDNVELPPTPWSFTTGLE
ncbi:MAG TPA: Ig-like domain-containing protein, partial [Bacillota bacterium]|nr:Ig-like domain-containing protein [Bacillota bacterium]